MAADLFEILRDFLCYGNTDCVRTFQDYASKPMEGIFYLVLFPTVFIIFMVYLSSDRLTHSPKIRLLIAMCLFAAVILQGWWYIATFIGRYWIFGAVVMGVFLVLGRGLFGKPKEGGASARTAGTFEGLGGALGRRLKSEFTGERKDLAHQVGIQLDTLEGLLSKMKSSSNSADIDNVFRAYTEMVRNLHDLLNTLRDMESVKGMKIGGEYTKLLKRFESLCRGMDSLHKSKIGKVP